MPDKVLYCARTAGTSCRGTGAPCLLERDREPIYRILTTTPAATVCGFLPSTSEHIVTVGYNLRMVARGPRGLQYGHVEYTRCSVGALFRDRSCFVEGLRNIVRHVRKAGDMGTFFVSLTPIAAEVLELRLPTHVP